LIELATIKLDLPRWPDDVLDQWLVHLANRQDLGWPPPDPFAQHPWKYILCGKPLSWWEQVTWAPTEITFEISIFSLSSRRIILEMMQAHLGGEKNFYSVMVDGKPRFQAAWAYILNNGAFPKRPIIIPAVGGLRIVDGNHRATAMYACQMMKDSTFADRGLTKPSSVQTVWIGNHGASELLPG
jgi:hypothetical protein